MKSPFFSSGEQQRQENPSKIAMTAISEEYSHVHQDLKTLVYLDTAGRSLLPKSVEEVGIEALKRKSKPWLGLQGGIEDTLEVRRLYAKLINAPSEQSIAHCPSTGFAMTMAMRNVIRTKKLVAGQSVIILEKEMASVVYPWQYGCNEVGSHLKIVPSPDWSDPDANWTRSILNALDSTVAVLALPHVHWCNGSYIDLAAISNHLQTLPADSRPLLIVDGTQSVGALEFDISVIQPAFLACSVHKWLLGSYGLSLVYLDPALVSTWEPLDLHEQARLGSDQPSWDEEIPLGMGEGDGDVEGVYGYPETYMAGARKLDGGGRPNYITFPMVRQSLTLLDSWTVNLIQTYTSRLTNLLYTLLVPIHQYIHIPSARCGHILGVKFRDDSRVCMSTLVKMLKEKHVYVAVRGGYLRIAPHVHTTHAHMHILASLLIQHVRKCIGMHGIQKKVLIVGGNGWLAQHLHYALLRDTSLDVYATYTHSTPSHILPHHLVYLDLANPDTIHHAIHSTHPDIIIHLAALTSPFTCHSNPTLANTINAPRSMLEVVKQVCSGCRYIFTSTDMVYDGAHAPYSVEEYLLSPSHTPSPVNTYGLTKLVYEHALLQSDLDVYVLRLSNMIGAPYTYTPFGGKFLEFLYATYLNYLHFPLASDEGGGGMNNMVIGLKDYERRSFVDIDDVVRVISTLIHTKSSSDDLGEGGISRKDRVLNIGGKQGVSRLGLAKIVADVLGVELVVVKCSEQVDWSVVDRRKQWVVNAIHDDSPTTTAIYANEDGGFDGLQSPKDITMVVEETEKVLGMEFTDLYEVVRKHIVATKQLLHPHNV